jgi:hypothetical protein
MGHGSTPEKKTDDVITVAAGTRTQSTLDQAKVRRLRYSLRHISGMGRPFSMANIRSRKYTAEL